LIFVIGAVIAVTAVILLLGPGSDVPQEDPSISSDSEQSAETELVSALAEGDVHASVEESNRIAIDVETVQKKEDGEADSIDTTLKMRFLDPSGNPLSGVSVTARRFESSGGVVSGLSGETELVVPMKVSSLTNSVTLIASLKWHAPHRKLVRVQPGSTQDIGDIVLEQAGAVSGRVIDRTGFPVAHNAIFYTGADIDNLDKEKVRLEGIRSSEDRVHCGSTDEDGTFRASAVAAGQKRIWAGGGKYLYCYSDPVDVVAGTETYGIEIVLDARSEEKSIECVVLDPDGKPVDRAMVRVIARNGSHGSSTSSGGRFKRVLKREGPYALEATDPKGRYEKVRLEDVKPGTPDLVLQFLAPRKKLRLLVSSSEGGSPGEFTVGTCSRRRRSFMVSREKFERMGKLMVFGDCYYEEFKSNNRDEDSTVSMPLPESDFFVTVWATGYRTAELGPFSESLVSNPLKIVLDPVVGISGRVLFGDNGVEGTQVSLHKQVDPEHPIEVVEFDCRSERDASVSVETDADGSFVLHPSFEGPGFLRATKEGFAPAELGPLDFESLKGQEELEVRLSQGGAITGHVIMAPGRSPAGIVVGASRGDGFPVIVRSDESGAFRFERLTPGPWLIEKRREKDIDRTPVSLDWSQSSNQWKNPGAWSCVVEEGETTRFNLDLSHETVCILHGTVNAEGLLSQGWRAEIRPVDFDFEKQSFLEDLNTNARGRISLDGSFTLQVFETDTYTLSLFGPIGDDLHLNIQDKVELSGGEATWNWSTPVGKVEVRPPLGGLEGSNWFSCRWSGGGNLTASIGFRLESNEPVLLSAVPVGKFSIEQHIRGSTGGPVILAESTAVAGETTIVVLE